MNTQSPKMNHRTDGAFAEVVESSLQQFVAQSWQWDFFPVFGSIVLIPQGSRTIIGVVHQTQTGSMDPTRYPFPYQKTEEELQREQPQIFEFLRTTFSCLIIGYKEKGVIHYALSPQPAKIHAFVIPVDKELLQQFYSSNLYLHVLFGMANSVFNLDELLLAMLRSVKEAGLLSEKKIANFIETFSLHTGNDYRRLKLFLQRIEASSVRIDTSRVDDKRTAHPEFIEGSERDVA